MKIILIVDDEPRLIKTIETGLKVHRDSFQVLTAHNGNEAVSILQSHEIDLVITDLKMPEMDGFELLAYITSHHPSIPAIVMTAFSTPVIEKQVEEANSLKLLEKPVDFDELADSIFESLEQVREEGSLTGISLASFLQLPETEQKTCLIEVRSRKQKGYIYFNNGELFSAVTGKEKGVEALYTMLLFDDVEILLKKHIKRNFKRLISKPLFPLLMEGMRLKDEQKVGSVDGAGQITYPDLQSDDPGKSIDMEDIQFKEDVSQPEHFLQGEENMGQLEETMGKLSDIEGVMAVGIFTPNGEMAASVNNSGLKLDEIGSLANDVLLKAQKATDLMDVGRGQLVHVEAPKAHIIARCLNENTDFSSSEAGKAHLHMVLILAKDGNLAMAKMKLGSVIQESAPLFR